MSSSVLGASGGDRNVLRLFQEMGTQNKSVILNSSGQFRPFTSAYLMMHSDSEHNLISFEEAERLAKEEAKKHVLLFPGIRERLIWQHTKATDGRYLSWACFLQTPNHLRSS